MSENKGKDAGKRVFEKLQKELEKKKSGLKKVAQRLSQGLDAKRTQFFQSEGTVTDERTLIDYSERRKYASLIMDVYGAIAPKEHVFPDKEGVPQDISGLSNLETATKLAYLMEIALKRKKETDDESGTKN